MACLLSAQESSTSETFSSCQSSSKPAKAGERASVARRFGVIAAMAPPPAGGHLWADDMEEEDAARGVKPPETFQQPPEWRASRGDAPRGAPFLPPPVIVVCASANDCRRQVHLCSWKINCEQIKVLIIDGSALQQEKGSCCKANRQLVCLRT